MPLIETTSAGLYCAAGGFHIDPWRPVPRAVVTHAHSDHARAGCGAYLTAHDGVGVLGERVGRAATIESLLPGESRLLGDVRVSLHPAGHILGSAQVRVEHRGEIWVVTGDYKVAPCGSCRPFEPVRCHTLITESTFGLPVYRWRPQREVIAGIEDWWRSNAAEGRASVLFCYALGKAQRLLSALDPVIGPILVHGAIDRFLPHYATAGIGLAPTLPATADHDPATLRRALVLAPRSADDTPWMKRFVDASTATASGWMALRGARRRSRLDRGFVLSDHADWDGLQWAIRESGAARVGVTHGQVAVMVRHLAGLGLDAFPIATRFEGEVETGEGEPALEEAAS